MEEKYLVTNVLIACTLLYTPYPRCTINDGGCALSWLYDDQIKLKMRCISIDVNNKSIKLF